MSSDEETLIHELVEHAVGAVFGMVHEAMARASEEERREQREREQRKVNKKARQARNQHLQAQATKHKAPRLVQKGNSVRRSNVVSGRDTPHYQRK